jgi:hypothetical protein
MTGASITSITLALRLASAATAFLSVHADRVSKTGQTIPKARRIVLNSALCFQEHVTSQIERGDVQDRPQGTGVETFQACWPPSRADALNSCCRVAQAQEGRESLLRRRFDQDYRAELFASSRVGCSDLLDHVLISFHHLSNNALKITTHQTTARATNRNHSIVTLHAGTRLYFPNKPWSLE